ncbi:3-carboxyethylcatechol 2,3-dioxygenase [Streptomyces sp. NPDC055092]|uniref:3-carboxyethylcatechol 2,3-dioxygenase n=1 Tax=Streptomyces sp. NPDC059262 TaxID=3346797 RepID=UPI00368276CF
MTSGRRLVVCASHSPGMERDTEKVQGTEFRDGLSRARKKVAEFDPELVVLFGGDHRRAFRHVVPAFGIALSAGIMAEAGHPAAPLDVPGDTARAMSEHLLRAGVDVAVCRKIDLDHAFAQPLRDLLGGLDRVPVIPLPINCATPPLPPPERALAFGRAVGSFLDGLPEIRILVIGTGGLSHSPPSLEVDTFELADEERARLIAEGAAAARKKIRPEWDAAFLEAMAAWDEPTLVKLTGEATERAGVGANEVRTWLAAGATGGKGLRTLRYQVVEEWITGMAVAATA